MRGDAGRPVAGSVPAVLDHRNGVRDLDFRLGDGTREPADGDGEPKERHARTRRRMSSGDERGLCGLGVAASAFEIAQPTLASDSVEAELGDASSSQGPFVFAIAPLEGAGSPEN